MAYDPAREMDRMEARFQREMDRRFADMAGRLNKLEETCESIEAKIDANTEKLEQRQYEKSTWTFRQVIVTVISFVLGGGALSVVQLIINALSHGGR